MSPLGLLYFVFCVYNSVILVASTELQSFRDNEIVPDVLPVPPARLMTVTYPYSGVVVKEGNVIDPLQAAAAPSVSWDACPSEYYTLAMVDPDVPSRNKPLLGEFIHWLVGNVPGNDVAAGETLASYMPPAPPAGSGLHRYVFLVYKQPTKISFDKACQPNTLEVDRTKFSIADFARKNHLGDPIYGNFFQAETQVTLV